MYSILYSICFGLKKEDAEITWQCVSELMWLCPNWGANPDQGKFQAEHRDLISLSVKHGQQGTDWGISKPCEKCHWSSCSSIFSFCHGCRRRAKQSPEVSIISLRPRGQEKSHYICCHTKSLSRCGGESTQQLWCDAGDPEIPRASHLSPRLEPSCNSNKWDTFHSDLR